MTVYLDFNATTPIDARVLESMMPYLQNSYGNPSSLHRLGRQARAAIDRAREQVAELVSAHPSQVIFTSGGTESNNIAIKGVVAALGLQRIACSTVEHSSVRKVVSSVARRKVAISDIHANRDGAVTIESFINTIDQAKPQFASVMWVNNETGVLYDVPSFAAFAREHGVLFHTDAVQAAGKVDIDFIRSGAHLMSISAHKIYGPKGVGALIVDKAIDIEPLFHGGGQEQDRRSGTENVAGIVGFGEAAELARREMGERNRVMGELRGELEKLVSSISGAEIFGMNTARVSNTVFVGLRGVDAQTLILKLDERGFGVASGSACSSRSGKASSILLAMGVEESFARSAIRISLSHHSTRSDIERFVTVLKQQVEQLRSLSRNE